MLDAPAGPAHRSYMVDYLVRALRGSDFEDAYAIVVAATDRLNARGIEQWPRPVPRDVYRARHDRGENVGCFDGERLVAVASLAQAVPERWQDRVDPADGMSWLSTLALAPGISGIGPDVMASIEAHLSASGVDTLYLDCVQGNGFLPHFYAGLDYQLLETREMRPGFHMCLFAKQLTTEVATPGTLT
ncbi:MAG: hypothetical protein U5Q44_05515 [Dehalococcoidia bacterium]|nr:hypothetical protein [Dehalococcoidia bacterium]